MEEEHILSTSNKMMCNIVLLTGQPGAGKTHLAKLLENTAENIVVIDGDELRADTGNFDYSPVGRKANTLAAAELAVKSYRLGKRVIVAMVMPTNELREEFKNLVGVPVVIVLLHTTELRGKEHFHAKNFEAPDGGVQYRHFKNCLRVI